MHSTCKRLPEHIRHKIEHRNNIRAQNSRDLSISELNSEITSLIQTHKSDIWREHLDTHTGITINTHSPWKTIHGLANKTTKQPKNNTLTFKEKTVTSPTQIANAFNKLFINTVKHKTHITNRHIDRKTLKLQTTNITLTTTQVQAVKKHSKTTTPQGPIKSTSGISSTWTARTRIPHQHVQHITKQQHHPSHMETSKHHTNSKTKQRHEHRHFIQTHLTSLGDSKTLDKTLLPCITNNLPHNMASKATTLQAQHYTTCIRPSQQASSKTKHQNERSQ